MTFIYYNVNEDGVPYYRSNSHLFAQTILKEFPNDTIVVVTEKQSWRPAAFKGS